MNLWRVMTITQLHTSYTPILCIIHIYIYMHVVTHMYTYMYICMTDGYMVLISMNVMFHDHFIVYRLSYTQLFDNFMGWKIFSWLYASFILAVFGQVSLGKIKGFLQLNSPTNLPEMSCFLTDLCSSCRWMTELRMFWVIATISYAWLALIIYVQACSHDQFDVS